MLAQAPVSADLDRGGHLDAVAGFAGIRDCNLRLYALVIANKQQSNTGRPDRSSGCLTTKPNGELLTCTGCLEGPTPDPGDPRRRGNLRSTQGSLLPAALHLALALFPLPFALPAAARTVETKVGLTAPLYCRVQ